MSYYKVLLVDDEAEVRNAIARKLDWNTLGFQVVGQAGNGEEGLELSQQLKPDVIMTDIKMPFMDGLTFCRRVKEMLPYVKVAILSGFDEFDYAKEAIRLEVEEYILKPIDAEELVQVFLRLRSSLDEEIAQRRDVQRLQQFYEENLPLMHQQLLSGLLTGHLMPEVIRQKTKEYQMNLTATQYGVAVIRYEEIITENRLNRQTSSLLSFSLQQLIKEQLETTLTHFTIPQLEHIGLLFLLPENVGPRQVAAKLNQLFLPARRLLGLHLSIGLGHTYKQQNNIARAYAEAVDALEYQVLVGPEQCIYIGDIEPETFETTMDGVSYGEEIIRQIKIGSKEELQFAIEKLVEYFINTKITLPQYRVFLLEMSVELLKLIRAYQLDEKHPSIELELLEKSGQPFINLQAMGEWLLTYGDNLRRLIRHERKTTTKRLVERAQNYLAEHFQDGELSVEVLSNELNVSPAYFSTLFKKETGLNFVAYLTQLRLEKALEYLHNTDEKSYIIAEKVGYTDPNYFSYVFKKQYGVSPSKYRLNRDSKYEKAEETV